MGTKVLSISLGNLDEGGNSDVFHAYAHCSNMEGKVAVLFVNIDEEKSFKLNLEHVNNTVIDLYHLTPHKNNLYSKLRTRENKSANRGMDSSRSCLQAATMSLSGKFSDCH